MHSAVVMPNPVRHLVASLMPKRALDRAIGRRLGLAGKGTDADPAG
jgi:hypothetical protein